MDTTSEGRTPITIHGFRVVPAGRITPGFRKALRRLAERGFHDPLCTVVKTDPGPASGVTHAGGRYFHPENPGIRDALVALCALGIDVPDLPFVAAPGECTLYHEWGHHVDRVWSGEDQDALFSLRWFSRFYAIGLRPLREIARERRGFEIGIGAEAKAPDVPDSPRALPLWMRATSELFADLFEDWMRGGGKLPWDPCEPQHLRRDPLDGEPLLRVTFLPSVGAAKVRSETFHLFEGGLRPSPPRPEVRADLFGAETAEALQTLHRSMRQVRGESKE